VPPHSTPKSALRRAACTEEEMSDAQQAAPDT
jgi:hypothetical protein